MLLRNALALALAIPSLALAAPPEPGDAYRAGYAAAVIERELGLRAESLQVEDGVLTVRISDLGPHERSHLASALGTIEGIERVRILGPDDPIPADEAPTPAAVTVQADDDEPKWDILPSGQLFEPLLADPRWPHFSASYQNYVSSKDGLGNVAAVSFGDVIPFARRARAGDGRFEIALHAAVFSIFDIDADSFDLINSDFLVGPAFTYRQGSVSAMLRVFHQSSHLGDEFLLRMDTDRINLSYEAVDMLVSWDPNSWLRIYGGWGVLLRREPEDLGRGSLQIGLEAQSPRTWAGGTLRPVFALDVQSRQESDWDLDISARTGLQIESPRLAGRKLQVLLDYFQGQSPNGQFFDRKIEYWALGAHLHF